MLWAVEGGNLHLMASIHISDQSRSALYPEAEQAYRDAERVTFEHDMVTPPSSATFENPPGQLLSQIVPSTVFANADNEWTMLGLPVQRLEQLQPWMAAMSIVVQRAMKRGFQLDYGVDKPLWLRTAAEGKARDILESADAALASFGSGPVAEQTLWLDFVTKPNSVADADFSEMMDAWHNHDDVTMERLLAERIAIMPIAFENAVANRNHLWMPALLNQVADPRRTLVVVGALHCVGEEGPPTLLK